MIYADHKEHGFSFLFEQRTNKRCTVIYASATIPLGDLVVKTTSKMTGSVTTTKFASDVHAYTDTRWPNRTRRLRR